MNQSDWYRRDAAARDWGAAARIIAATDHVEDGYLDLTAGTIHVPNKSLQKTNDRDLSSCLVQGVVVKNGQSDDRTAGGD